MDMWITKQRIVDFPPKPHTPYPKYRIHITLYNTDTGAIQSIYDGHRGPVGSVSFTGDGKRLYTCSNDGKIIVWNVPPKPKPGTTASDADIEEAWNSITDNSLPDVEVAAAATMATNSAQAIKLAKTIWANHPFLKSLFDLPTASKSTAISKTNYSNSVGPAATTMAVARYVAA